MLLKQRAPRKPQLLEPDAALEAAATHMAKMFNEAALSHTALVAYLQTLDREARIRPHDSEITNRVRSANQAVSLLRRHFADVEKFRDDVEAVVNQLRREVSPADA